MNNNEQTRIFESLEALLDDEEGALLRGDLSEISELLERKQALFDALNAVESPSDIGLEGLREKTLRNQVLLEAALEGIRSVADRIAALREVRQGLETYDREGQRKSVPATGKSRVEKRA